MSSRLGTWLIGLGAVILLGGLCILPTALGKSGDPSLLAVGACFFSMGAVTIAIGIYIKARSMQAPNPAANVQPTTLVRKQRGGCDLCGPETPAIFCKTHQLHMCATCLDKHYDIRSCVYIPTSRKSLNKPAPSKPVKTTVRSNKVTQAKAHGA